MALELNGTTGVSLVQDGVVTAADLASTLDLTGKTVTLPAGTGGKVLQVVSVFDTTNTAATTVATLIDTGLAASITPSSTSSKILVMALINNTRINGTGQVKFGLSRQINGGGYSNIKTWGELLGYVDNSTASVTPWYYDTPNTTSQVDYKYQFAAKNAGPTVVYQNHIADGGVGGSNLILMEIAG